MYIIKCLTQLQNYWEYFIEDDEKEWAQGVIKSICDSINNDQHRLKFRKIIKHSLPYVGDPCRSSIYKGLKVTGVDFKDFITNLKDAIENQPKTGGGNKTRRKNTRKRKNLRKNKLRSIRKY